MKATTIATTYAAIVLAALAASTSHANTAAGACPTPQFGSCGSNSNGVSCCPSGQYCQPWNAGFYQCMPQPAKCSKQLTNVDYPGNDLQTLYSIQPDECCKRCSETPGCAAYTFVNSRPGPPACYLKKAAGSQTTLVGAVSGVVNEPVTTPTPVTPSPDGKCATAAYASCGNSKGSTCCPTNQYCQPWNAGFYQCMDQPKGCPSQLTDTDYVGNDLKKLALGSPGECCDACKKEANCKAYTFINSTPDGSGPACYLKKAAGQTKRVVGAVAAKLH